MSALISSLWTDPLVANGWSEIYKKKFFLENLLTSKSEITSTPTQKSVLLATISSLSYPKQNISVDDLFLPALVMNPKSTSILSTCMWVVNFPVDPLLPMLFVMSYVLSMSIQPFVPRMFFPQWYRLPWLLRLFLRSPHMSQVPKVALRGPSSSQMEKLGNRTVVRWKMARLFAVGASTLSWVKFEIKINDFFSP